MSPTARRKQHQRLWWRTWHRQHARAIRRAARVEQEMLNLLPQVQAMLHAWAVAQDGHEQALSPVQYGIYQRHRHGEEAP